ncbi:MAG TPA: hypothetical protein VH560_12135 [Polyangia bacterium]|jgi:hypothetical protein|nr:hypothetical protein [Polyangia bacterium]
MAIETETKTPKTKDAELRPEVFDDYDAFLKQAIRDFYDQGWKSRRGSFIALLIASGQMTSLAADSIKDGTGLKRAALGAAGVVALRIGLRYALSGPLGIILTGAAAVSLVSYLVTNQKEITTKVGTFRTLIAETRTRFEETQGGYRAGRYDAASRNLMVDGLLKRFLEDLDAA